LEELSCFNNNISILDIFQNSSLTTLRVQSNNLDSTQIDNIIINLDNHGLSNGTLAYNNNPGSPTNASLAAYNNLLAKGWTITGLVPSALLQSSTFEEKIIENNNNLRDLKIQHPEYVNTILANNNKLETIDISRCENLSILDLRNNILSTRSIDSILNNLVKNGLYDGIVKLSGVTNSRPSNQINVNILKDRGWIVSVRGE
jgi:hypothetical protein